MGQAFTLPPTLMPYTYNIRGVETQGLGKDYVNKVGFLVVGLNHSISDNVWNTSVKANMTFLKDIAEYSSSVSEAKKELRPVTSFTMTANGKGAITKDPITLDQALATIVDRLEGGYYHPSMLEDGRLSKTDRNVRILQGSGETLYGIDRKTNTGFTNSKEGKEFWSIIDSLNPNTDPKWEYGDEPKDPTIKAKLISLSYIDQKKSFNTLFSTYIKDNELKTIIQSDGRLFFNFVYAVYNGSGYFEGFSKKIVEAYNSGVKSSDELLGIFLNLRKNIRQMPKFANYADFAVELMNGGAYKIAGIVGVSIS
jgi:hypothetical protein